MAGEEKLPTFKKDAVLDFWKSNPRKDKRQRGDQSIIIYFIIRQDENDR